MAKVGLRQSLVALGHRNYRLFYVALLVAGFGAQIQRAANLFQVYELTNSTFYTGLTGLAQGLTIMTVSLIGGVIADRVDRRKFIMLTQGLTGLLGFLLALLTASGEITVWHIYVVTVLTSLLTALNTPARSALVPNLVPQHHLLNALALNSTVWQVSNLVGPAIAGTLIARFGLAETYAVNGAAHFLTLGSLAFMQLAPVLSRPTQPPLKSLLEGLSFVRRQSIILILLSMDVAARFLGSYHALLPVFARSFGVGARGLGLLLSAPAGGALLGSLTVMSIREMRYKGLVVAGGILAYCLSLILLAVSPSFGVSLLAAAALGLFDSFNATPRNAIIQTMTPDDLRGRVSSFQSMLTTGPPALGYAQSGALAALIGVPLALTAGAVTCTLYILALVAWKKDLRSHNLGDSPGA
jgi:MFS family permease